MTFDLSKPDHERALRGALDLATHPTLAAVPTYFADMANASNPPLKWAFEAVCSPTEAAKLIRQLAERAGVPVLPFHANADASSCSFVSLRDDAIGVYAEVFHHPQRGDRKCIRVMTTALPATIARLFAVAPKAGLEAVLVALKGPA